MSGVSRIVCVSLSVVFMVYLELVVGFPATQYKGATARFRHGAAAEVSHS